MRGLGWAKVQSYVQGQVKAKLKSNAGLGRAVKTGKAGTKVKVTVAAGKACSSLKQKASRLSKFLGLAGKGLRNKPWESAGVQS